MKCMFRSFLLAFSMYSKIPVPQFAWKEEDMQYMLCFFPWIGAVIGGILFLWNELCGRFAVGGLCRALIGAAVPLAITGGFHVDGFMDTMDAFCSYSPRERKLEILKDSHIGAFSVIMLALYGLIYLGAFSEIKDGGLFGSVCGGFFLSRCLSGIAVVSFPGAKKEGMLCQSAENARKTAVRRMLYLQGALCIGFMVWQSVWAGLLTAAAFISFYRYFYRTKKELGGITGDTAGYFVVVCEICMMAVAAVADVMVRVSTFR
ncbi:MAG: adenosylcobinamide-GDP ribazoletransferase [Lachnospiraceae bacterium]|nr:adenosylcobinamide-GDP ribazoletransferase [Lachnospiraceae bacterium]